MKIVSIKISENELIGVIDSAYEQIIWSYQASEALKSILYVRKCDLKKFNKSKNFFSMARMALAEFSTLELEKILNKRNNINIFRILHECRNFPNIFRDQFECDGEVVEDFNIFEYTKCVEGELNKHQKLINNLKSRRDKTFAHNDKNYFHFSKAAIDEFPMDNQELDELTAIVYSCLRMLHLSCGSTANLFVATDVDDLKRLFELETESDEFVKKILGK